MSVERVREYLKQWNAEERILEFDVSSATVELAAQALHCAPAHIAKTLSFHLEERVVLIVAAGVPELITESIRHGLEKRQSCLLRKRQKNWWAMQWAGYVRLQ